MKENRDPKDRRLVFGEEHAGDHECDGSCGCVVPCSSCKGRHHAVVRDVMAEEVAAPALPVV